MEERHGKKGRANGCRRGGGGKGEKRPSTEEVSQSRLVVVKGKKRTNGGGNWKLKGSGMWKRKKWYELHEPGLTGPLSEKERKVKDSKHEKGTKTRGAYRGNEKHLGNHEVLKRKGIQINKKKKTRVTPYE